MQDLYNPWTGLMATAPALGGYSGGFGTALMLKDLSLAQQAAPSAAAW